MKEIRAYALMIAVVALAVAGYVSLTHTADVARKACERAMRISPELAVAYERYKILSPRALQVYIATIPKSC